MVDAVREIEPGLALDGFVQRQGLLAKRFPRGALAYFRLGEYGF